MSLGTKLNCEIVASTVEGSQGCLLNILNLRIKRNLNILQMDFRQGRYSLIETKKWFVQCSHGKCKPFEVKDDWKMTDIDAQ